MRRRLWLAAACLIVAGSGFAWWLVGRGSVWSGAEPGAIRLELEFPGDRLGGFEPLVSVGNKSAGDLVYVSYAGPQSIRFGLVGTKMRGPISPEIPFTPGRRYRLDIQMGPLCPEAGDAALAGLSEVEVALLQRTLKVTLDGQTVFETPAHFSSGKQRRARIGLTSHLRGHSAERFSGRIHSIGHGPLVPPRADAMPEYGPLRLRVKLPTRRLGEVEPLLVTGVPGAADFIVISYIGIKTIAVIHDHWGIAPRISRNVTIDPDREQEFEILLSSLLAPPGHPFWADVPDATVERLRRRVRIRVDGQTILDAEQPAYDSAPHDVLIGRNAVGGSSCGYQFTGTIIDARRDPASLLE